MAGRRRGDAARAHRGGEAAIPAAKRSAFAQRGEAATKAHAEDARAHAAGRRDGWDASPISTARLCMETCNAIKDARLVARFPVGQRQQLADRASGRSSSTTSGSAARAATASATARRPRSARRSPTGTRALLGQHPGRRRPDVRARRAVDRRASQDPAARRDAQQPRLPPGSDARAAHRQLPQPAVELRRRPGPGRHADREPRHRVPQARGVDGLVGEGPDQGSVAARGRRCAKR